MAKVTWRRAELYRYLGMTTCSPKNNSQRQATRTAMDPRTNFPDWRDDGPSVLFRLIPSLKNLTI